MRAGSIGRALNAAKLILVTSLLPVIVSWDGDEDKGGGMVFESMRERREEVLGSRKNDAGCCFVGDVGDLKGAEIEDVRPGDMLEWGEWALRLVGDMLDWLVNRLVLPGDVLGPVGKVGRSTLLRME
jgi:hypothetical protein